KTDTEPAVAEAATGNEAVAAAAFCEPIEPSLDLGAQDPLGRAWSGPGMETTEEKRFVEAISVRSFHPLRLPSPMTSKSKNNEVAGVTYGIQPLHGGQHRLTISGVVHQNCQIAHAELLQRCLEILGVGHGAFQRLCEFILVDAYDQCADHTIAVGTEKRRGLRGGRWRQHQPCRQDCGACQRHEG